jgi:hypothetical protein
VPHELPGSRVYLWSLSTDVDCAGGQRAVRYRSHKVGAWPGRILGVASGVLLLHASHDSDVLMVMIDRSVVPLIMRILEAIDGT